MIDRWTTSARYVLWLLLVLLWVGVFVAIAQVASAVVFFCFFFPSPPFDPASRRMEASELRIRFWIER